MLQSVGNEFTGNDLILNLLPGFNLPMGNYQISIQYYADFGGIVSMNHITSTAYGTELLIRCGKDVRQLMVEIANRKTFKIYQYSIRVDRLILLNIAVKLI
jgi:hypothetical protein